MQNLKSIVGESDEEISSDQTGPDHQTDPEQSNQEENTRNVFQQSQFEWF